MNSSGFVIRDDDSTNTEVNPAETRATNLALKLHFFSFLLRFLKKKIIIIIKNLSVFQVFFSFFGHRNLYGSLIHNTRSSQIVRGEGLLRLWSHFISYRPVPVARTTRTVICMGPHITVKTNPCVCPTTTIVVGLKNHWKNKKENYSSGRPGQLYILLLWWAL